MQPGADAVPSQEVHTIEQTLETLVTAQVRMEAKVDTMLAALRGETLEQRVQPYTSSLLRKVLNQRWDRARGGAPVLARRPAPA